MSSQPVMPHHLTTVSEYLEIGEVESGYTELDEGRLLLSRSPTYRHRRANGWLWAAPDAQLPPHLVAVPDIDVDLQLAPTDGPGTVRRPDVAVVRRAALDRIDCDGGVFRASEAVLAVEIVSPGSRRRDQVLRRAEYADASIPHYWISDLDPPVSALTCHPAGEFGHVDGGAIFRTTEPFPFEIDLETLLD